MPFVTVAEEFGREEGYKQGGRAFLLKGIAVALELKFGSADAGLMQELGKHDLPVLEAIKTAAGPDDLRRLLPQNGTA
jgi:hypothetical protein